MPHLRPRGRLRRWISNIPLPDSALGRGTSVPISASFLALRAGRHFIPSDRRTPGARESRKVVNRDVGFIYCAVPLAGSSSIIAALTKDPFTRCGNTVGYGALHEIVAGSGLDGSCFVFSFVRNPWSRVVSCYHKKIFNANTIGKLAILSRHPGLRPGMSFEDFIEWLCSPNASDEVADPHWASQHAILSGLDGQLLCDFVGRLERLENDLRALSPRLGVSSLDLPRINASDQLPRAPQFTQYRDYYTPRTRDLVARRYARDVEIFGYAF